jgi:hypothetical protein
MLQQAIQKVTELPTKVKQAAAGIAALLTLTSCGTMPYQPGMNGGGYGYQPAPMGNQLANASLPQTGFGGQGVVTRNNSNYSTYGGFSNQRTVDYGDRIVSTRSRASANGFSGSTQNFNPITGASTTFNYSFRPGRAPQFNVTTTAPRINGVNPAAIYRQELLNAIRRQQQAERAAIQRAARAHYGNN